MQQKNKDNGKMHPSNVVIQSNEIAIFTAL